MTDPWNAFVAHNAPDEDVGLRSGPLAGARLAVKDNIGVHGLPFTAGHALFARRVGAETAPAVVRLTAAGARVVGVTRTDAGGFGVTTPEVTNPRAADRIAGGSSGGSAAAVAAGQADIGLGTDTGGSVRIPAACCGVYGYKPTYGRVPTEGVWPMAPSFDHVGVMAGHLVTLRRSAEALLGQTWSEEAPPPELRVGVDRDNLAACDAPVRQDFETFLGVLKASGMPVQEVSLPESAYAAEVHGTLVLAEARRVYARWWPDCQMQLGEAARRALLAASRLDDEGIARAQEARIAMSRQAAIALANVDIVLSPTLAVLPPRRGSWTVPVNGHDTPLLSALMRETCLADLTGDPALVLPLRVGSDGPLQSLQLVTAQGRDALLFAYAKSLKRQLARAPSRVGAAAVRG